MNHHHAVIGPVLAARVLDRIEILVDDHQPTLGWRRSRDRCGVTTTPIRTVYEATGGIDDQRL
ncbi:MAG: hypothetical protein U5O39_19550 [Gammaproteobacteria bacterium]|nr:hypothetical protein [Gammaproteobacteria bacterium]